MASKGLLLEELTWVQAELALTPETVVVLPLGASAKEHGPHLPLCNDWTIAEIFKHACTRRPRRHRAHARLPLLSGLRGISGLGQPAPGNGARLDRGHLHESRRLRPAALLRSQHRHFHDCRHWHPRRDVGTARGLLLRYTDLRAAGRDAHRATHRTGRRLACGRDRDLDDAVHRAATVDMAKPCATTVPGEGRLTRPAGRARHCTRRLGFMATPPWPTGTKAALWSRQLSRHSVRHRATARAPFRRDRPTEAPQPTRYNPPTGAPSPNTTRDT